MNKNFIQYKTQILKPLLIMFLLLYIVYGACVVFGAELSQENSDGATKVTAKIEQEQSSEPTTEEIPDSTQEPEDNPPIQTGEKMVLGFLFFVITSGLTVIAVTYRSTNKKS